MHGNARLTRWGRRELVRRIEGGMTVASAAASMNVSRQCAHKWWRRWQDEGVTGLEDRSSRPLRCPHQTPPKLERRIVALRRSRKLGPARLAGVVGVPASTVHRVLVRHGINQLRWMDRPTGRVIRRIETSRCGELVHIDVKKLARVPDGGGHKILGRSAEVRQRGGGYTHIHTAIDAYSRLAYSEFAGIENTANCVAFLTRAVAWFTAQGITIERILTDIQRQRLSIDTMAEPLHRARHPPLPHQALSARHQRQGRTLQPDPARRVGLHPPLAIRGLTGTRP